MLPKSSMAARCLTMTLRRAMRTAPWARVTVVIMGRNSGVSPTASATANRTDSSVGRWRATLTTTTNSTRKATVRMMSSAKCRMPRWNSVSGGGVDRRAAMSPNAVSRPVATTTARAVPLTTDVPRNTRFLASAGCRGGVARSLASFSAGIDSPVSAACCTWRSRAASSRASAGTRSPAPSLTISPRDQDSREVARPTSRPAGQWPWVPPASRSRSAARWER